MTKSEGSATGGDNAESLAEDLLKRFSDTQPEVKKEPISGKLLIHIVRLLTVLRYTKII